MKGLLKIGYTEGEISQRIKQLDTTGVPQEFVACAVFLVNDPKGCESALHEELQEFRVRNTREFFRVKLKESLSRCIPIINACVCEDVPIGDPANLTEMEESILQILYHSASYEIWPQRVSDNLSINRQEAHYALGELRVKGFLNEDNETFSLTHKGRKYVIESGLAIKELLD